MNKYKLINLALFLLSLLLMGGIWMYWELICKDGDCTYNLMVIILQPITQVSVVLSVVTGLLIFFPSHYFEKWFKWVFTWLLPLYLILIYKLGGNSGQIISFPYALVAQLLGYIFGGITIVFVVARFVFVHYIKKKSQ